MEPGMHIRRYHGWRNEKELFKIREYIRLNPVQWDMDEENPVNIKKDDK
jgi:hypothetical protein